ncbi:hypothetical protein [Tissierella praeacuta]|uniref:hypothetical protein n=1 Tax=Tissierella praeacuta TaxID=43131 RepID=UPI001C116BEA|nr:hypothetical protein [Tissierella praeacuta]MBU5256816.1 hypothetical protein [Tissierella praeacuta]
MYIIVHFFILRSIVSFNVNSIGAYAPIPFIFDEIHSNTWYLPVGRDYKFHQLKVLYNIGLIILNEHENENSTSYSCFLTQKGWDYYHEKMSNISTAIFQCIWNVIILLFGYYLGKLS